MKKLDAVLLNVRAGLSKLAPRLRPQPLVFPLSIAAGRMDISLAALRELVKRKQVRSMRLGRVQMVSLSEVERLVRRRARPALPEPSMRRRR